MPNQLLCLFFLYRASLLTENVKRWSKQKIKSVKSFAAISSLYQIVLGSMSE